MLKTYSGGGHYLTLSKSLQHTSASTVDARGWFVGLNLVRDGCSIPLSYGQRLSINHSAPRYSSQIVCSVAGGQLGHRERRAGRFCASLPNGEYADLVSEPVPVDNHSSDWQVVTLLARRCILHLLGRISRTVRQTRMPAQITRWRLNLLNSRNGEKAVEDAFKIASRRLHRSLCWWQRT
jgi:hypothetical protein